MSGIDPRADPLLVNGSRLGVTGYFRTATVTLLSAEVEGSMRLWQDKPDVMAAAMGRLNQIVGDVIAAHGGVRSVEHGEGDSFEVAFSRAPDAVAAALQLQRAPLAPIRLRIGVRTGEVQLHDEGGYAGASINSADRLRDLAHGGQTVLSSAAVELVADRLPDGAWLTELGAHRLRGLHHPERVTQLCHPDLVNQFPPLRLTRTVGSRHLPVQLTSFIGRGSEIVELQRILAEHRLVTLTGAGGVGKTRLAVQLATQIASRYRDGLWYVDLGPITDPELVALAAARALGLPDQPGRSTIDTLCGFVADRELLVVLDTCEHLLDASAALVVAVLGAAPGLTVLATSREPLGVPGEVSWRVPSLSLADEAIELFIDRARHARPDLVVDGDDTAAVVEICTRLDGLPLAIELAAARVRALTLAEILDGLHDRFRLLTAGARTAVRRHQTLRALVDWSHALLTDSERVMFRRLAVFVGGFDLDAARAIAAGGDIERDEVLDQLSLLIDKSLVVADSTGGTTRYRLLDTVRQYAAEKLDEAGEGDGVHARHRDHYAAMAAALDTAGRPDYGHGLAQVELEIDNLRAAFSCSREHGDPGLALRLASSLQPLWLARGRVREGLDLLHAAFGDLDAQHPDAALRARALADMAVLGMWVGAAECIDQAHQGLALARRLEDPAVLARTLTACGFLAGQGGNLELARRYLGEAIGPARTIGDRWRLSQILASQAQAAIVGGDPLTARAAGQEGRDLADAIGDGFHSRQCRYALGGAHSMQGDLAGALAQFDELVAEAEAAHDEIWRRTSLASRSVVLACQGQVVAARADAEASLAGDQPLGGRFAIAGRIALGEAALAAGDLAAAHEMREATQQAEGVILGITWAALHYWNVEAALADGDLPAARGCAEDAILATKGSKGHYEVAALLNRARVAIATGEVEPAERDARDALALAAATKTHLLVPDILECLAVLAGQGGSHREAARLFGAAEAIRLRIGTVRLKVYDASHQASVTALRDAMGEQDFDSAWAEGAALSTEEAIGYAQRGRGQRKRPSSGWASLTPTELEVVRLVSAGMANNDIAAHLFVSPRTVQTHLSHVYTKLGVHSRVQLTQEAARHS
jgi:predicted ATPase/class 3 adenylate cyclase/DNA-binding CsgD family transcriptional regulator